MPRLTVPVLLVVLVAAAVFFGHNVWAPPVPPAPVPQVRALAPACPTPPPFKANTTYIFTGCELVPPGGYFIPSGVTIDGGQWLDPNVSPCPYTRCSPGSHRGRPAFTVEGAGVTLEHLSITGANRGGYHSSLAFNSAIESLGVSGLTITDVVISHPFGDGITADPLRSGRGHNSIVASTTDLIVNGLIVDAAGRQSIALVSVDHASLSNLSLGTAAFDSLDFEADTGGEGTENVTVDGGTGIQPVNISSNGPHTGPLTFSAFNVTGTAGAAVNIRNLTGKPDHGQILFNGDRLRCGASSETACLQIVGGDVLVEHCTLAIGFPHDALKERVYAAGDHSMLTFGDTSVTGVHAAGTHDATSTVINPIGLLGP